MTLQQLEYLVAVNRTGSFSKAAQACLVTQPTLSAMIQKLEDELGAKLLDRNQQPIVATPLGRIVLKQAHEMLLLSSQIKARVEEEHHTLKGSFKVGILPTIAPYLLPRFFPTLMKKYPELDIHVAEMKTNDILHALPKNDIDVGIVALLDGMDSFVQDALYYEQFYGYVAREDALFANSSIRSADLKSHKQLWLLDEGHCFRDQLVHYCQLNAARLSQQAYSLGSMETFMRMVESGRGITFIPELAIDQLADVQKELVRPFAIPCPTRQIVLLSSKDLIRQSVKTMIIDEIRKCVPKEMLAKKTTQQLV